ncbi:hypothetical protein YC2023_022760 [Brassica napus]
MSTTPPALSPEGIPRVMIPDEVFERGALQHKDFVVGRFFGRVPAFKIIQNVLNFLWGKGNKLEIHMIQSTRSMIVRIPSDYIREKVLKKRIWYVDTAMFHVAQWSDGEVADTSSLEVIPIWAHLIGVPFDLMTNEGLGWIADALGEPKEMDDWTKNLSSLSVAHVKVEADATKPFPTVLELVRQSGAMFRVEVEYPWLPPSCSHCKELGHIIKDCLKIKRQWVPVNKAKGTQDSGNTPDPVVITVHEPMSEDPQASNPNGIVEDSSRAQTPPPPSSIGDPKPVSTAMEIDPLRSPLASTLPPTTPNPTPPCPLLHPPQSPTLPSSPNPLDSPISPCLPPLNYVLALAATVMPKSSILPHTVNSCAALSVPADPPFPLPEDVFVSQAPYLITNDVVAFPPLSSSKWESPKRKKKYFTKLTTPPPPVKNSSSFNSFSPLTDSSLSHPSLPCPASSSTSRPPDQNPSNHSSDLTSSTHPTSSSVLPPVPSFGESYPVAVSVQEIHQTRQSLTCKVTLQNGHHFFFSAVYASNYREERLELWEGLLEVQQTYYLEDQSWLIGGDLNQITHHAEHSSPIVNHLTADMVELRDFLLEFGVEDLRFQGNARTWTNKSPDNPVTKKLDRALVNNQWIRQFPNSIATFLPHEFSDHSPCVVNLACPLPSSGTKPFKFFNHLTSLPNFLSSTEAAWTLAGSKASDLSSLGYKLKNIKRPLKTLHNESLSDIQKRVCEANNLLKLVQVQAMADPATTIFNEERELQEKYHFLCGIEESFFQQKSRVNWLRLGDHNTPFYQSVAAARASQNAIRSLTLSDGTIITDPDLISTTAVSHFESIMAPQVLDAISPSYQWLLDLHNLSCSDHHRQLMSAAPTQAEIANGDITANASAKVAWETCCLAKDKGGLSLRNLDAWNTACALKMIWLLFFSKQSIWSSWFRVEILDGDIEKFWGHLAYCVLTYLLDM